MKDIYYIVIVILGMSLVTFIPRAIPMLMATKNNIPEWVKETLEFIPIAILSSLLAKDIFFVDNRLYISIFNIKLLAAAIVLFFAYKFKSLTISIFVGVICIYLLDRFV